MPTRRFQALRGSLDGDVPSLYGVDDLRVLGQRAERFGFAGQRRLSAEQPLGRGPDPRRVEPGEHLHGATAVARRREVSGCEAHDVARSCDVHAEVREQVAAASPANQLSGDVAGCIEVDQALATVGRPEHGEVRAVSPFELEVHAGSSAAQRADQLPREAVPFRLPHARQQGHAWVEIQRKGALARLDDQPFHAHHLRIGARHRRL